MKWLYRDTYMPLMEKITSMHQEIVKQRLLLNKEEKNELRYFS